MKLLSTEKIDKLNHFKSYNHKIEINNNIIDREFLHIGEAVAALVYDKHKDKFIFVKQFRPGSVSHLIELVGGLPENGLTPEQCIEKEILEEIGYKCDIIERMAYLNFVPCYSNEKLNLFYVVVSEKISLGGGDRNEGEYIDIIEMTKNDIFNFDWESNSDAKTILALSLINYIKPFSSLNLRPDYMDKPNDRVYGC